MDYFEKAKKVLASKKVKEAQIICDKGLAIEPKNVNLIGLSMEIFYQSGQIQDMLQKAHELASLDHEYLAFMFKDYAYPLSFASFVIDSETIHKCLDIGIEEKNSAKCLEVDVGIFIKEKKYSNALTSIEKILKNKPNSRPALRLKGDVFYSKKDYASALKCYNKVIELNPGNSSAISKKLKTLFKLKEYDDFRKVFAENKSLIDQFSVESSCNIMLNFVLLLQNKSEEAIKGLRLICNRDIENKIRVSESLTEQIKGSRSGLSQHEQEIQELKKKYKKHDYAAIMEITSKGEFNDKLNALLYVILNYKKSVVDEKYLNSVVDSRYF